MNWLKSAAGEFLNELSSDIKEMSQTPSKGGSSETSPGRSTGDVDERPHGVTTTQGSRPNSSAAPTGAPSGSRVAEKAVPNGSQVAEKAAPKPVAVVARPLTAEEEELFDWDDSGDEVSTTAATDAAATTAAPTAAAAAANIDAGLAESSAEAAPQTGGDGWPDDDDLEWPDEEVQPLAEDLQVDDASTALAGSSAAPLSPAEASSSTVSAAPPEVPDVAQVGQAASMLEVSANATEAVEIEQVACKEAFAPTAEEVEAAGHEVTETSAVHAEELQPTAEEAEALVQRQEPQQPIEQEVERLSALVRELEHRCEEQAQAAALNAANSQAEVISLLHEAKDRERALEAELRELRSASSNSSGAAAELQRRLEERTAESLSLTERLEEESKMRAAAVAEADNLRRVAQERERLLEERSAELSALRDHMAGQERPAASTPEAEGVLTTASTISEVLESFAKALADAQGKVLTDRLQALRGKTTAQVAAQPFAPEKQVAAPLPVGSAAAQPGHAPAPHATDAFDEEDIGWGSDDDVIP